MELKAQYEAAKQQAVADGDDFKAAYYDSLLAQLEDEGQKQAEAHEARIAESKQQINYKLDNLNAAGLSMRQLCAGDTQYDLLRVRVQQEFTAQADTYSRRIMELEQAQAEKLRAADDRESQLQRQHDELQKRHEELQVKLSDAVGEAQDLRETNYRLTMENDELEKRRQAAAQQLTEAQQAAERFSARVKELEQANVSGNEPIDTEEEARRIEELAKQIKREKTIYGKQAVDFNRSKFRARLAATGDEITFSWTDERSYIEIDLSAVEAFREEYGIQSEEKLEKLKEPSFPGEETGHEGLPVAEGPSGDPEPVQGQEEQELTLEQRVAALEAWRVSVDKQLTH